LLSDEQLEAHAVGLAQANPPPHGIEGRSLHLFCVQARDVSMAPLQLVPQSAAVTHASGGARSGTIDMSYATPMSGCDPRLPNRSSVPTRPAANTFVGPPPLTVNSGSRVPDSWTV
jgi:hypothetical protein